MVSAAIEKKRMEKRKRWVRRERLREEEMEGVKKGLGLSLLCSRVDLVFFLEIPNNSFPAFSLYPCIMHQPSFYVTAPMTLGNTNDSEGYLW